ncbi:MAG: FtsX-like permease family protein [Gemmatimonadales bacterium]|nr:FtsX-like permease family protein [Gemmatimonadales bacterium]NIN13285.1 FtsX-like permease family protein [Gemmatimonadales bacterium]NIQ99746.1 FtsX-like permease family protein [Gemmatimonadales bacterium]NIS64243.1 FtsX-like permease family protein [Gemmatimonadales bacterium]
MGSFWRDVRFALRSFRRERGFTLASVLVLALGIGAVTAMFTILNSVVLRPLPFEQPERLVWAWGTNQTQTTNSVSALNYVDYREQADAFESLAAFLVFTPRVVITGDARPERAFSTLVSANFFRTLGIRPQLGRSFAEADEDPGSPNVVIVSNAFLQRRFAGDERVVGVSALIGGESYQILGVMPPGFDFPGGIDLWFPMRLNDPFAMGRDNNNFYVIGRLRDGVSLDHAQAQVDVIAQQLQEAYPETNESWSLRLVPLHERFFAGIRSVLVIMMGLVALVLLIACANVASLALARAATRSTEIAVRFSLGASRPRVIRQLLTESLFVALAGGGVGLLLALGGITALKSLGPASLPRLSTISVDKTALAFTIVASLATALLFGTVPALRGTRVGLAEALRAGGIRGSGPPGLVSRNALVVAQVALSFMLMIASGLLARSYVQLQAVDAGFNVDGLQFAEVQLPDFKYGSAQELNAVWSELHERVRALPGVTAVGAIDQLPIRPGGTWNHLYPADRPPTSVAERNQMSAQRRFASVDYFDAAGIALFTGRAFESTDRIGNPNVTVISRTMADQFFPGEDPVGRILILPWNPPISLEVVGVVGDVREFGLGSTFTSVFYLPARQFPVDRMQLVIRSAVEPRQLAGALRGAVRAVDDDIPTSGLQAMETRVSRSLAQPRFRMLVVALFAAVALILSSTGLYGVLAYFVRQRTRELGIRVALGAAPRDVVRLVVRRGMTLVCVGAGLGLLGAVAGARVVRSVLFQVAPTDALTFGGVSACLAVVALVACLVPAFRAVRLDPQEALRTE